MEAAIQEKDMHHRQSLVQGWNQEKVRKSTVLIAGMGALGCEVAKNLAMMGVGNFNIIDNDRIELSNLSRQLLFTNDDIGSPKVERAAKRLQLMNPQVNVTSFFSKIQEVHRRIFEASDIIIGGLDNWPSRRFLNSIAIDLAKPYIDGGTYALWGNVQVVIPNNGPCLECQGAQLVPQNIREAECTLHQKQPEDLYLEIKKQGINNIHIDTVTALFNNGFKTVNDIKYGRLEKMLEIKGVVADNVTTLHKALNPKMPALLTINAIIAGIQAQEALKLIQSEMNQLDPSKRHPIGQPLKNFIQYDSASQTFTTLELAKNEYCAVCSDHFRSEGANMSVELSETVSSLAERITAIFGYPDVKLQFKTNVLSGNNYLKDYGITEGDQLFVHSSRIARPLRVIVKTR